MVNKEPVSYYENKPKRKSKECLIYKSKEDRMYRMYANLTFTPLWGREVVSYRPSVRQKKKRI